MRIAVTASDWVVLIPELIVLAAAGKVLMIDAFAKRGWLRRLVPWTAFGGAILAAVAAALLWNRPHVGFGGMFTNDNFAVLVKVAILSGAGLAILMAEHYVRREDLPSGEFYSLMLLSALGMMLLASSTNLIMIFLTLETLSIALYVLTGLDRARPRSQEAGLKYFLLGSFSAAFLVYGVALTYGATGTLDLRRIAETVAAPAVLHNPVLLAGAGLILVGLGFKVAVVPFQMWTPDVYEGAPSPATAFMSIGSKAAAFAALARMLVFALRDLRPEWIAAVWVIAALTMAVGNIVAIAQDNIKRMLAYSSIAHAGYILVAVAAANDIGAQAIPFYLIAYAFMNLGAWAVVTAVTKKGDEAVDLGSYSGLFWSHPVLAGSMALFMFALAGLPPTSGFTAKVYIFMAAVSSKMIGLLIIAIVTTIISAYFYLRVTVIMFLQRPPEPPSVRVPAPLAAAIVIAAIATFWLFLFPGTTAAFTHSVAASLR